MKTMYQAIFVSFLLALVFYASKLILIEAETGLPSIGASGLVIGIREVGPVVAGLGERSKV